MTYLERSGDMWSRLAFFIMLAAVALSGSGCVIGVYSKQHYGPGNAVKGIAEDQSLAEVVRTIGAPDKVYDLGETKLLVYNQYDGKQILGVYGEVKKSDMVILLENGRVAHPPIMVAKGEAMTILGVLSTPVLGPILNKEE